MPQDRLFALSTAFRAFAEVTTDYARLLDTVAQTLVDLIGDACVVSLVDEQRNWITPCAAAACDASAKDLLTAALSRTAQRDHTGQSHRVVETGAPILIARIEPAELATLAEPAFADAVRTLGIRSFLSVPLGLHGRRLGALSLFRYRSGAAAFDDEDRAFATSLADHAALAISNAQLFESLQHEREKAKTFVALIENSTDFIAMADLDGRVRFVNAAGRALVGLDPDHDASTLTLADFHTSDGLSRAPIIRERGSWQGEGVLRHFTTGALIPTQISSFLARDTDGKPLCFATVQHDLRETKRLEGDLRQSQKMEALGRLAGGIAHDFNNLLTVILSYSAILRKTLPADSRGARDIAQIERAGLRAAELTHQLLAFSRKQVLEPKALDLGTALHAMDGMIRRLIGEDIELRIIAGDDVPAVMVDAGQVEQVVLNLVVNARDAMQSGGVLTLETSRLDGGLAMLSVCDTGTGIDAKTQAHMFEPFFTTKDPGKGTGLGLSTVMGIVEQSGGSVTVDSAPGRGTTLRVILPAAVTDLAIATPRTITAIRGNGRILLVEDEGDVRQLVGNVLRDAGYQVIDASDGEIALAALDGPIDLLLTDVIMPKMSGRELAARILEKQPEARVLYMSGYTDDKLGHHGVLDRDVELIQKPLTPDVLLRRVRDVLAK